jgi:two-component system nitrogen regulation sensor histidine kinase GlnL
MIEKLAVGSHHDQDGTILESIVNALPTPVVLLDADNRIRFANGAAEGFFQAGVTVLCKGTLEQFVPFASPLLSLVAKVRASGSSVNEYSVDIGTPRTGGSRQVDLQVASLPDLPGSVLVTIQPRAMAQKIDSQLTHRGAARSVTGMAAMLAHEIKNPLSGIRGAAQLLESVVGDEDRNLTQLICEESDRICGLVDQMEVFTDERPLVPEPVNIHSVLDHVKSISINGFASGIKVTEEYDPSLPTVPGNRGLLIQVFLNLVKNAAESIAAQGTEGEIALTTAFRPGIKLAVPGVLERVALPLEVCVKDTGAGVPDDLRPYLFDPFVSTKAAGKGLGLALVAKVVRDHGGIIECPPSDRWTIFRVLLPMHPTSGAVDEPVTLQTVG